MKHIISQCGQQIFTCGECQVYNVATITPDDQGDEKAKPLYSVGVAGLSFGIFRDVKQAEGVLRDISSFLSDKNKSYTVPQCTAKK